MGFAQPCGMIILPLLAWFPTPLRARVPGKGGGVLKLLTPPRATHTPPLRWEGS